MINKKKMLALTGVFLPYNTTISILSYKHLRTLDYDIDVLAMKTDDDLGLKENFENDPMHKKFNILTTGNFYKSAFLNFKNCNPFAVIYNILKYSIHAKKISVQKKYDIIYSSSLPNFLI